MRKSATSQKGLKRTKLKKQFILICSCCAAIFVLFVTTFNLNSFIYQRRVLGIQTELQSQQSKLLKEKAYWVGFLAQNPNYFSGWVELTKVYIGLGDMESARAALTRAGEIKPNSELLRDLEQQIK